MTKRSFYLFKTDYFHRDWTWMKRALIMMLLNMGVLLLPMEAQYVYWKVILIFSITTYMILKPVDDLALDRDTLYHIRKSVFSKFTRIDRYDLSVLNSIRVRGFYSDQWEIFSVVNGAGSKGVTFNSLEMSFDHGGSCSLELTIGRDQIDQVIKLVDDLKGEKVKTPMSVV